MQGVKRGLALLLSVALLFSGAAPALAGDYASDFSYRIDRGAGWLAGTLNPDGGVPAAPGEASAASPSAFARMALVAAGRHQTAQAALKDFLLAGLADPEDMATLDLARNLLALTDASGEQSTLARAADELAGRLNADGRIGREAEAGMVNAHVWGMLALYAQDRLVPDAAVQWLLAAQNPDGGFSWRAGGASDPDSTGAACAALGLVGLDESDEDLARAVRYLARRVTPSGGVDLDDVGVNAASDAWAAMGLAAVGVEVRRDARFAQGGRDMLDHLVSLQRAGGWFSWREGDDSGRVMMSAYGVLALTGSVFGLEQEADDGVALYVRGRRVQTDVSPVIVEERLLVPLSVIAGGLGAEVAWDHASKTVRVSRNGRVSSLIVGEPLPDGLGRARIVSGRTMVPLRYLAKTLGMQTAYRAEAYRTTVQVVD